MNSEAEIKNYEIDIRKISFWYFNLWPRDGGFGVEDLMSAGREAVWQVSQKRPDKLNYEPYVKGAIRFSIINRLRKLTPKIPKQIHLVKQYDTEVPLVDLLPNVNAEGVEKLRDIEELSYYINQEFSPEFARSLESLIDRCNIVFDVNLSKEPSNDFKDKLRVITKMDLSDEEMLVYASVLLKAINHFPRDYVVNQKERSKKYFKFLLEQLGISPEEFGLSSDRLQLIRKYGLDSFYQRCYNGRMQELFADIFPDLEPHMVRGRGRWQGREGLINGYNAIDWVKRKTGKKPNELTQKDFLEYKLDGLLKVWFGCSFRRAVEFRYPGTYPKLSNNLPKL